MGVFVYCCTLKIFIYFYYNYYVSFRGGLFVGSLCRGFVKIDMRGGNDKYKCCKLHSVSLIVNILFYTNVAYKCYQLSNSCVNNCK